MNIPRAAGQLRGGVKKQAQSVPASLDIAEAIGQARQAIVTQVKLSPDSEIAETPW